MAQNNSLTSHWQELSHMATLAAKEGGKCCLFFQAYMCSAKTLSLGKQGSLDIRGPLVSSLFPDCDLNYSRSSWFGLKSRETGACSPSRHMVFRSGNLSDSSNFCNHKEASIRMKLTYRRGGVKQVPEKNAWYLEIY